MIRPRALTSIVLFGESAGHIAWEVAGRRGSGWRLYFGGACPELSPRARTVGSSVQGRYEDEALTLGLYQSHERVASMHGMAWRVLLHSWPGVRCSYLVLTGRIWADER